jgi:hypothetical protein
MGKKCAPGVICIENMTMLFIVIALIGLGFVFYRHFMEIRRNYHIGALGVVHHPIHHALSPISDRNDTINDPYAPPLKTHDVYYPRGSSDIRGIPPVAVPVNIQTRALNTNYQQMGILTRMGNNGEQNILPLMGRRIMSGRDKWQFYTIANNGNLNTKLPISVNGKSCTSEYGCDDINNGDVVFVEGYNDTFQVTMYENNLFQYIPNL